MESFFVKLRWEANRSSRCSRCCCRWSRKYSCVETLKGGDRTHTSGQSRHVDVSELSQHGQPCFGGAYGNGVNETHAWQELTVSVLMGKQPHTLYPL